MTKYVTEPEMAKFMGQVNKRRMRLGLDEILVDQNGNPIRLTKKGKFVRK